MVHLCSWALVLSLRTSIGLLWTFPVLNTVGILFSRSSCTCSKWHKLSWFQLKLSPVAAECPLLAIMFTAATAEPYNLKDCLIPEWVPRGQSFTNMRLFGSYTCSFCFLVELWLTWWHWSSILSSKLALRCIQRKGRTWVSCSDIRATDSLRPFGSRLKLGLKLGWRIKWFNSGLWPVTWQGWDDPDHLVKD